MLKSNHLNILADAINQERPLVLFLGQNAWNAEKGEDYVLQKALERINCDPENAVGYQSLISETKLAADFYDWIAEEYDKIPTENWLNKLASLPLNAIFTTSINSSLDKRFRMSKRSIQSVLSKDETPSAPMSKKNLHITYLFGRAGEISLNNTPPSTRTELQIRTGLHTSSLLARLTDTVTALGYLLIDGYSPNSDWLTAETFSNILAAFPSKQVLWFGWNEDIESNYPIFHSLSGEGCPIIPVRDRLSKVLSDLEFDNRVTLNHVAEFESFDTVSLKSKSITISSDLRFKTSTGATIIDDSFLDPLTPLGKDLEYAKFKEFHCFRNTVEQVTHGVKRNFTFERSVESKIITIIKKALSSPNEFQNPILVHGQSGSGKSILLARIVYALKELKEYPILFTHSANRVPRVEELEDFCKLAEESGAKATLIVCDSNASTIHYNDLARSFISRGRKVIIIGSIYRQIDQHAQSKSAAQDSPVTVNITLDTNELTGLNFLLKNFIGTVEIKNNSEYLLPIFYRILPEVRPRLASGLANEALVAEKELRTKGHKAKKAPPCTQLGVELAKLNLYKAGSILDDVIKVFSDRQTDSASRIIDYVMTAGKFNSGIPINLLMRAVGGGRDLVDIAHLFLGIDLFRWVQTDDDDILIYPRLQLEAELIISKRGLTSQQEIETLTTLINHANPSILNTSEMRFILDLIQKIGPDGAYKTKYSQYYLSIAKALTELRVKRGITDARLMLQESAFRRRYLRDYNTDPQVDSIEILEEARSILDLAMTTFTQSSDIKHRRSIANLAVERAAIYGFRALQVLEKGDSNEEVWRFYEAARRTVKEAAPLDSEYYSTDIGLWIPSDLLKKRNWDLDKQSELIADIWDTLDNVDLHDSYYNEQFEERRVKVAHIIKDTRLEEDALKKLEEKGSTAGYYLKARKIGGDYENTKKISECDAVKLGLAAEFLTKHIDIISSDVRCLKYLLKCKWAEFTKYHFYSKERAPLPSNPDECSEILEILERLEHADSFFIGSRTKYLKAVMLWMLKREHEAKELWKELSSETQYHDPRRVIRHHILTDSNGLPKIFFGRIEKATKYTGKFKLRVEGIRQEIDIFEQDFRGVELKTGISLPNGFHIVFNYIGPLAERVDKMRK